jgi:hypothetical protein
MVDNRNVASLNGLLMRVLLPIILFVAIARTPRGVIAGNADLVLVLGLHPGRRVRRDAAGADAAVRAAAWRGWLSWRSGP